MVLILAWVVAVLSLPASAIAADADANASNAQALIALEHQWIHAASSHDRATLSRILDPSFTDISWRGTIRTRAQVLAGRAAPGAVTQKLRNLKARIYGKIGIVNGLNVVAAKNKAWQIRLRFTDIFVKRHGMWRAVSAQETLVQPAGK